MNATNNCKSYNTGWKNTFRALFIWVCFAALGDGPFFLDSWVGEELKKLYFPISHLNSQQYSNAQHTRGWTGGEREVVGGGGGGGVVVVGWLNGHCAKIETTFYILLHFFTFCFVLYLNQTLEQISFNFLLVYLLRCESTLNFGVFFFFLFRYG